MELSTVIGTNLCELSPKEKESLGINFGVKIMGPISGLLTGSNLSEGFIITRIDGRSLSSLKQLELQLAKEQGVMIEGIYPDGTHDRYFTQGFQA